mmetsp:Transcript_16374/g.62221  ORF Transcript_16374/g.62221 Transcript_16374/m.62221 type:complete len:493 (-) Transcript_16374:154-1632(-)
MLASVWRAAGQLHRRSLHASRLAAAVKPFILADIGEGIAEVELLQWFVKPGDSVREFDPICEVQSDKATAEISSRYTGTVETVHHPQGAIVAVGQPLIDIDIDTDTGTDTGIDIAKDDEGGLPEARAASDEAAEAGASQAPPPNQLGELASPPQSVLTTPAVRRLAREHGIDLTAVGGSGPRGRILKEDVLAALQSGAPPLLSLRPADVTQEAPIDLTELPMEQADAALAHAAGSEPGGIDELDTSRAADRFPKAEKAGRTEPCRGYQRLMVKSMTASLGVPHFGYNEELVVDELKQVRHALQGAFAATGLKLTYMPFLIKACSLAMREFPILNASFNAADISVTYHDAHNIGVAMDTPRGLIVPCIKGCNNLSLWEIAAELGRLQGLAAGGQLGESDLSGTTFSISNVGSIGGTTTSPVIVPPQVAIGAFGRIRRVPRFSSADSNEVVGALVMDVSWSGDHRVIDGATMARFSNRVKEFLETPSSMLIHLR